MITLTIGKMNKKPNSTKRVLTSSTSVTGVTLKENVDIKAPVFKLNFDTSDYNYVVWGDRYYYIDNTVYVSNNLWEIHCSLDLLATYRDAICGQSCILAYKTQNPHYEIDDLRFNPQFIQNQCVNYNQSIDPKYTEVDINDPSNFIIFDFTNGSFIINCTSNGDALGNGAGPHNWLLNLANFKLFMKNLYSAWTGGPFQGPSARVDAINSIIWVPFKYTKLSEFCSTADLEIAGSSILTGVYYFNNPVQLWSDTYTLAVPRADTDSNIPRFMHNSRWTKYELITPAGVTDIDADILLNMNSINMHIDVDCIEGTVVFKAFPTPVTANKTYANHILYEGAVNYAIDMSWTLQRIRNFKDDVINFTKSVTKVGATVAASYAGGPLVGAAAGKVVAAQAKVDSFGGLNIRQNGNAPLTGAKLELVNAKSNLAAAEQNAKLGQAGAFAANIVDQKLHVPGAISENFNKSNSIASLYGTNSTLIILSLKVYVDPALTTTTSGGTTTTAKTKYSNFCQIYGYPQPSTLTTLPETSQVTPVLCVVKAIQLSTSSSVGNMDADEVIAIETLLKHGVWFEQ